MLYDLNPFKIFETYFVLKRFIKILGSGFLHFIKFGEFLPLFLHIFFFVPSFLSFGDSNHMSLRLPLSCPQALCSFLCTFSCFAVLLLFLHLLTLFSAISHLLIPSSPFISDIKLLISRRLILKNIFHTST